MIRLIAFDMDGTVLDEHKKILPQTKEKLECAAAQESSLYRQRDVLFAVCRRK